MRAFARLSSSVLLARIQGSRSEDGSRSEGNCDGKLGGGKLLPSSDRGGGRLLRGGSEVRGRSDGRSGGRVRTENAGRPDVSVGRAGSALSISSSETGIASSSTDDASTLPRS